MELLKELNRIKANSNDIVKSFLDGLKDDVYKADFYDLFNNFGEAVAEISESEF